MLNRATPPEHLRAIEVEDCTTKIFCGPKSHNEHGITMRQYIRRVQSLVDRHQQWRGRRCLNLIPSENVTSLAVRRILSSDFVHRYTSRLPFYQGTKFVDQVEELGEKFAKELFRADYADLRPLSGHLADIALLIALTQPGDMIISIDPKNGGYPGLGKSAIAKTLGRRVEHFPFNPVEMNIEVEASIKAIRSLRPKLIILGASFFLFPHPIQELREVANEIKATIAYDGSHVLGLIAGRTFQDPLREGAAILLGSTHKTFPGPQGGIILGKSELKENFDKALDLTVDNYHLHRVAALTVALAEMLVFGKDYAAQTVKNAKALGKALEKEGFRIKCAHKGYTMSHQLLLDTTGLGSAETVASTLEKANIIVDRGIRLGTQEITRLGMKEKDMGRIAELFREVLVEKLPAEKVALRVCELQSRFTAVKYCFDDG